jgi:hypothetical protein
MEVNVEQRRLLGRNTHYMFIPYFLEEGALSSHSLFES